MFYWLRNQLKKNRIARAIYFKYYDFCVRYRKNREESHFMRNGEEVIAHVQNTLSKTAKVFFFDMGTLLGIYRDGRLIRRDMDIDVGVQISTNDEIDEVRKVLLSHGFFHKFVFSTDNHDLIQDTFTYKGITVDISYYRQEGVKDYIYMIYNTDDVLKMVCRHVDGVKLYPFGGLRINVPIDTEKYLEDRYGVNWKKPDPSYKYWEGPSVIKVEGRGICERQY